MKFTGFHQPVFALAPDADRYAGDPATDVVNMKKYDHITFLLMEGAGGTGTATLTVEKCTALDGTGATAIPFMYRTAQSGDQFTSPTAATAAGITTTAGAGKMVAIEVSAVELGEGYPYLRLQITEVADSPVDACVLAIASEPRWAGDPLPSAIS